MIRRPLASIAASRTAASWVAAFAAAAAQTPPSRPELPPIAGSRCWAGEIRSVGLVGGTELNVTRDQAALHVTVPETPTGPVAFALRIRQ